MGRKSKSPRKPAKYVAKMIGLPRTLDSAPRGSFVRYRVAQELKKMRKR